MIKAKVPHYELMLYGGLALSLASGTVMIVSGAGLIGLRRWARGLTIGYACYNIAMTFVSVVFFFVVAQLISWLAFNQPPARLVYVGGAFIVLGGLILSVG